MSDPAPPSPASSSAASSSAAPSSPVPTGPDVYRAMAVACAKVAVPVALVLLGAAWWLDGTQGLVGGVVGAVVVLGALGSSPLLMSWATRSSASQANPHFAVMVAMGSWVLKVSLLALLVLLLAGRPWLSSQAFALVAAPTALVWLVAEMRAFSKARTPIYDTVRQTP